MFYECSGWRFGCRAAGGPPGPGGREGGEGGEGRGAEEEKGGHVAAAAVVYIRGEGK